MSDRDMGTGGRRLVGPWDDALLLFIALIVVGVVILVRSFPGGGGTGPRPEGNRALDILDERFARGEVDEKEYEERRRILTDRR